MKNRIKILEEKLESFGNKLGRLQGEVDLLDKQQKTSEEDIKKYKENGENYKKAVEIVSLVQKISNEKVKESFEQIVTHALNFIYDSNDYKFELVFTKRGSLPELKFSVKTPDKDEAFDPLDTDGGGTINILSFALRVVLMEISNPKTQGFILSDESFANLSSEYIENAGRFLKEVNTKMKRQIIAISHQKPLLDIADNLIEIK